MNETLSLYEALDLIANISGQLDSLFNYWISASFAVIVGTFIGREHLKYAATLSISLLYFLASAMFLSRFWAMVALLLHYTELTSGSLPQEFLDSIPVMRFTRIPTFAIGFLVTEVYLWHSYLKHKKDPEGEPPPELE